MENSEIIFGKNSVPSKYIIQAKFVPIILPSTVPFLINCFVPLLNLSNFWLIKASINTLYCSSA